jgi:hypothetical protein
MSILQEYQVIRKEIGEREFSYIEKYLEENRNLFLSDIYYKRNEYKKFKKWYKKILTT